MTKCWLIPFLIAGLFGDKAFADCLPAPGTPASVIEHFQRFNKPLPEQFCAKEAAPQASHEPPQESSQAPDQYGDDDGPGDGPFAQYEGDPGGCPFRKLNPTVLMVKSTQDVASDDAAAALNGSAIGGIFLQAEMGPCRVVIRSVFLQDAPKMGLAPHDHVVKTLTSDRADCALDISVLPW